MEMKVGDYIKCMITNNFPITKGKLYRILEIGEPSLDHSRIVFIINDEGVKTGYYSWRFNIDNRTIRKEKLLKLKYDSE